MQHLWLHPWLTRKNLSAIREASAAWRNEAKLVVERADRIPDHFAFVGNIANGMYLRAKAIGPLGAQLEVFGLHGDHSIFSDARWEEYHGTLPGGTSYSNGDKSFLDEVRPPIMFSSFEETGEWAGNPRS